MIVEIPVIVTDKVISLLERAKRPDLVPDGVNVLLRGLGWGGLYDQGRTYPEQPVQTEGPGIDALGGPTEITLTVEHLVVTIDMLNATVSVKDALNRPTDQAPFFILRLRLPDIGGLL